MGAYVAYQREALEIVDELRRLCLLEQVMGGAAMGSQRTLTAGAAKVTTNCGVSLSGVTPSRHGSETADLRITTEQYWADLNERMPD